MIILAWFGGIVVAAIVLAAIYDQRARRRGLSVGPTGEAQKRLNASGTSPFRQGGIASWTDDEQREQRPGDQ